MNKIILDFEQMRLSQNYIEMDVWEAMIQIDATDSSQNMYKNLISQKNNYIRSTNVCPKNPQQKS